MNFRYNKNRCVRTIMKLHVGPKCMHFLDCHFLLCYIIMYSAHVSIKYIDCTNSFSMSLKVSDLASLVRRPSRSLESASTNLQDNLRFTGPKL